MANPFVYMMATDVGKAKAFYGQLFDQKTSIWKTLGRVVESTLADMRKEASKILARAHLGTDLVAEANAVIAQANAPTLGKLVPLYLKAREGELREKSRIELERYLTKTWKPLHSIAIETIKRRDIVAHLDTMAGKVAADRARLALAGLFGWAVERAVMLKTTHA